MSFYHPLTPFLQRAEEMRESIGWTNLDDMAIYDAAVAAVDPDAVAAFQNRWRDRLTSYDVEGALKYSDIPYWLVRGVWRARRLRLSTTPQRVLDIGTATGYFPAALNAMGHHAVGTDVAVPLYDELAALMGVDRRIAPVAHRRPHPDVGGPFDHVVIGWQTFDILKVHPDGSRDYWSLDDWRLLLGGLAARHMTPSGRFHISLNPIIQKGETHFDETLMAWCEGRGGTVDRAAGMIDIDAADLVQRFAQ